MSLKENYTLRAGYRSGEKKKKQCFCAVHPVPPELVLKQRQKNRMWDFVLVMTPGPSSAQSSAKITCSERLGARSALMQILSGFSQACRCPIRFTTWGSDSGQEQIFVYADVSITDSCHSPRNGSVPRIFGHSCFWSTRKQERTPHHVAGEKESGHTHCQVS